MDNKFKVYKAAIKILLGNLIIKNLLLSQIID